MWPMKMKKNVLLPLLFLLAFSATGQKKPLDHNVYDGWKNIDAITLTQDSKFAVFGITPQEGDADFVSLNLTNFSQDVVSRGTSPRLTQDGKYAILNIKPLFQETREARIKRVPQNQMPLDTLGVYNFQTRALVKIPYLKTYKIGTYANDFLAFQTTPPADTNSGERPPRGEGSSEERPARRGVGRNRGDASEGENLMVYQLSTGRIDTIKNVTDYAFSNGGDSLFIIVKPKAEDSLLSAGLFLYLPKTKRTVEIFRTNAKQVVKLPYVSDDNKHLLFFANLDTVQKEKSVSIIHHHNGSAKVLVDNAIRGLPEEFRISEQQALQMDKASKRIFFGIAPIRPERDTTIPEFEQAKVDVWHWSEPDIMTVQLRNVQRDLNQFFLCKLELDNPVLVRLAKEEFQNVVIPNEMNTTWAYAVSDFNYRLESQWVADPRRDLYLINVLDGRSKLVLKDHFSWF
jgi:hypothetical protein